MLLLVYETIVNEQSFQAIRGAAPSFGIVTQLTVHTQPAPSSNILFDYNFNPSNTTAAANMFMAFQTWAANTAPPEIGAHVELGVGSFALSGVYYGTQSSFTSTITPLLNAMGQPTSSSVQTYDWIGVLEQLGGGDGNLNTSTAPDISDTFYAKSLMVADDALLTESALVNFFQYLYGPGVQSDTSWFILVCTLVLIEPICSPTIVIRRTCGVVLTLPSTLSLARRQRSPTAILFTLSRSMPQAVTMRRLTPRMASPSSPA